VTDTLPAERRLQDLERGLRRARSGLFVLGLGLVVTLGHDFYLVHRLRRSTFTDSLTVPVHFWQGAPVLNIATDGSQTGLTIGGLSHPAQVRLEQASTGESRLIFYDLRGNPRLRLGLDATGEPIIQTLAPDGTATWSTILEKR